MYILKSARQPQSRDDVRLQPIEPPLQKANLPPARGMNPGDQVEEGGLSGTIWADDGQDFPWPRSKAEVVDGQQSAKLFAEMADIEEGICSRTFRGHRLCCRQDVTVQRFPPVMVHRPTAH